MTRLRRSSSRARTSSDSSSRSRDLADAGSRRRRASDRRHRSDRARPLPAAGRLWRRRRGRGWPVPGDSALVRRPASGHFCDPHGACAPAVGASGGRDRRPRGPPRLCAHARDPRAAHSPRQGDQQYLHQLHRSARSPPPPIWRPWERPGCGRSRSCASTRAITRQPRSAGSRASRINPQAPEKPFFKEFVVRLPRPAAEVNRRLREEFGIIGGYDLGRDYPHLLEHMLIAVTELHTRASDRSIGRGARITCAKMKSCKPMPADKIGPKASAVPTLYELSVQGRHGIDLPRADVPEESIAGARARARTAICRSSPSSTWCATFWRCRSAISASIPASIRSAPAP